MLHLLGNNSKNKIKLETGLKNETEIILKLAEIDSSMG